MIIRNWCARFSLSLFLLIFMLVSAPARQSGMSESKTEPKQSVERMEGRIGAEVGGEKEPHSGSPSFQETETTPSRRIPVPPSTLSSERRIGHSPILVIRGDFINKTM